MAPLLYQEHSGANAINTLVPLTDLIDIRRHGIRRFDMQTNQTPDLSQQVIDVIEMSKQQRYLLRDWYCLNPYFLSGTINLGVGRPDIKIGTKARILGVAEDDSDNETYYIESVSHNWSFGVGTRTMLGVTRGWIGTDNTYQEALEKAISNYGEPSLVSDYDLGIQTG
jgi:hypothetical protein